MKKYSWRRVLMALAVSLTVAGFLAFALRQFLGRGRFLDVGGLGPSRYAAPAGYTAAAVVFASAFVLLFWLLARAFAHKEFAEFIEPGMYHYYRSEKFGAKRIHLRVEKNRTSLLMVDAYRIVHLNETATVIVKFFLDDYPSDEIVSRMSRIYKISRAQALKDYTETIDKVELLITRDDICPISYFGVDKIDPFQTPVSAPYRMDLAITYRCNIDCSHCYNQRKESAELGTADWKKIIRKIWDIGIPHVVFTGGEPTLREDLVELITYAEDIGLITGLLTNGVNLADEGYVGRLKEAGLDYVQVTLESPEEAIHNRMVQTDSFGRTVQGIRNALARSIHTITNTTITRENAGGIIRLVPFLKGLGVGSFAVNSVINAGRSRNQPFGFSEQELVPILTSLRNKAGEENMKLTWYTPTCYCEFNPVELDLGVKQCTAGKYNLAVEPDGTILPCQSFYRPVGNMLTGDWEQIYNGDFLTSLRNREWRMEKCTDCRWLATCGCGCPLQVTEDSFCCPDLLSNP